MSDADDADIEGLRRRDRGFVLRLVLRLGVALLLGTWVFLQLTSDGIGNCAARGFQTVTGEEGVPPEESPE